MVPDTQSSEPMDIKEEKKEEEEEEKKEQKEEEEEEEKKEEKEEEEDGVDIRDKIRNAFGDDSDSD